MVFRAAGGKNRKKPDVVFADVGLSLFVFRAAPAAFLAALLRFKLLPVAEGRVLFVRGVMRAARLAGAMSRAFGTRTGAGFVI